MADFTICSQVSWLDHFLEQKLHLFSLMSSTGHQVRLCSGDGFSVSLPTHLLVAASKVARNTLIPGQTCQYVLLPSVRGSTLLLLVETLRNGMTGNLGMMDNLGHRLKEVQEAMTLLEVPGCIALTREGCSISDSKLKVRSVPDSHIRRDHKVLSTSILKSALDDVPNMGFSPVMIDQEIKVKEEEVPGQTETKGSEDVLIDPMKERVLSRECHVCKKKFMSKHSLKSHIRNMHKESMYQCDLCDIKFILECHLKEHIIQAHEGNRISCNHCKSTYRNKVALRDHMRKNHRSQMLSCVKCDKHFFMETTLRAHVRNCKAANQENQISCDHCNRTYVNKEAYIHHMRKSHKDLLFACLQCDMHFFKERTLQIHVRNSHAETHFQCGECPAKFTSEKNVKNHMGNVHSGILHVCKECQSTFSKKTNLKRHTKNVHKHSLDLGDIEDEQLPEDGNITKDIEESENIVKLDSV